MTSNPFRMAALAIALALAGCSSTERTRAPSAATLERLAALRLDPAEAERTLNAYRASYGLRPVRLDPALSAMAQRQAEAMAASGSLSHTVAGGFVARIHQAGIDAARSAENLGGGYFSTAEAFEGWRKSSGHDANLRMPEATRFGIGLAKNPQSDYLAWWALAIASDPPPRGAPVAAAEPSLVFQPGAQPR